MAGKQGCKKCRDNFSEDEEERNYNNYDKFGFKNEEQFRKHNSGNRNCPYKKLNRVNNINHDDNIPQNHLPIWQSPKKNTELIHENDYIDDQEINQIKLNKHNRGGRTLWFPETKEASANILSLILSNIVLWITLVAEPGSGKTMVIHHLIYQISKLPYHKSINKNSITITTGMSDKEWYDQIIKNFELKDGDYLWEPIHKRDTNYCIVHRSNFHKRITYLLENQKYLNNHIFIIDESHFADDELMTIDQELKRLGLTEERMKQYNIKVILISATPDVNLSLMDSKENHKLVQLKNGKDYHGFKKHYSEGRIIDDDINDLEDLVNSKYTEPRYHYVRARSQQDKGQYRSNISDCCKRNDWILIEDDSNNDNYISFNKDYYEKNADKDGKQIIKTYNPPSKHTFVLIKNKYQASKRLQVTSHTGIIYEKKSKKRNASVSCNGLIPRFWGYYPWPAFNNNEQSLFICDEDSVKEYIKFSEDFKYEGKDYTGRRIISTEEEIKQKGNTCYGSLADITPVTKKNNIDISPPFDKDFDIQNYLLNDMGFREAGITVTNNCRGVKGEDEYMYPKRNVPGHTRNEPENTFLTEETYKTKFVNKGSGSFINTKPQDGGTGQSFMVYPVYKNTNSDSEDFKYYVHSLKIQRDESQSSSMGSPNNTIITNRDDPRAAAIE